MNQFVEQAKADYEGKPVAIADHWDQYDELHVIIKMQSGKEHYYLDWIGGAYADYPDEFEQQPFPNINWQLL